MIKRLFITIFLIISFATVASANYMSDLIVTGASGIWTDSRSYGTLNDAITAIGASDQDLYIAEPETVTTLTIPANIRLHFLKTGSIANTGQLNINTKQITAGDQQIFTGTGDIDFANGSVVRSAWFSDVMEAFDVTNDDNLTLVISKSAFITDNCAVGDNVNLKWESPRTQLTINSGYTLSNIKNIEAGSYQLFAGAGDFDFLDGTRLNLSWFRRLRSVINWVESENVTLDIYQPSTVSYNGTVPSNLSIEAHNGGFLTINPGVALTINGSFRAGIYHTLSDAVAFGKGSVDKVYPQWFGAYNDGTHAAETIAALQGASDSAPEGGTVFLPVGEYAVNDQWTIGDKYISIIGEFSDAGYSSNNPPSEGVVIISTINNAASDVINWTFDYVWKGITIKNISIVGGGNERDGVRITCTDPTVTGYAFGVNLESVAVHDVGGCGFYTHVYQLYHSIWENLRAQDCGSHGYYFNIEYSYGRSNFVKLTNLIANQCTGYGFYFDPFGQAIFEWLKSEFCAGGGFYIGSQSHYGTFIECQSETETETGVDDAYGLYGYKLDSMSFISCGFDTGYLTKQAVYLDGCHSMFFYGTVFSRLGTLGAGVKTITLVNDCTGIDFESCRAPNSTYDNLAEDDSSGTYTKVAVNSFKFTRLDPGASTPTYWSNGYASPDYTNYSSLPRFIYSDLGVKGAIYPPNAITDELITATVAGDIDLSGRSRVFLQLTGAENITSFSGGKPGQEVTFYIQNSNATFVHVVGKIYMNGAVNWNPVHYDIIKFGCDQATGGRWREVSRSDNT